MSTQAQGCPECEEGRLRLPLAALVSRSVVVYCTRCGRRYCSQLTGPWNMARNSLMIVLGTVLGGGLVLIFLGRWSTWVGGFFAFAGLNAICSWLLHRRNVVTGRVKLLTS
jgi:hypothetical protein